MFLAASASVCLSVPSPGLEHNALKGYELPESTSVGSHFGMTMGGSKAVRKGGGE